MIEKSATYRKSAKGADAIAHRDATLSPRLRSLLILVDGKRPYAELAKVGAAFGDPDQLLSQLSDLGLIEAEVPAAPAAPATPAAPEHPAVTLAQAQRYAVRRLNDILGPNADDMCMKIEATRNVQDFMAVLHKAENAVRDFSGARAAEQFAADMKTHRPA